jgi:DNA (cytosine-5)-methyltransferase 1
MIIKYLSLFSGIGGFECAINRAVKEIDTQVLSTICIGYSEIDKYAKAVYEYHFPTHLNLGDVRQIDCETIELFDILVGGFPCQAFSRVGTRQGFMRNTGSLFFEIARIAERCKPSILFLENVPGLLSNDRGRTFAIILQILDELGYDIQWAISNSNGYTHQNRKRVYILGFLRGRNSQYPLLIPKEYRKNTKNSEKPTSEYSCSLTMSYGQTSLKPLEEGVYTLKASGNHGIYNSATNTIRPLTPLERERLQGFPDNWTQWGIIDGKKIAISNHQRIRQTGNAVTVPVVQDIVSNIFELMGKDGNIKN